MSLCAQLAGRSFRLLQNADGQAGAATEMHFGALSDPLLATYAGPNVIAGQAMVTEQRMVYQQMTTEGALLSGAATVELAGTEMRLHWRWVDGSGAGTSHWVLVEAT